MGLNQTVMLTVFISLGILSFAASSSLSLSESNIALIKNANEHVEKLEPGTAKVIIDRALDWMEEQSDEEFTSLIIKNLRRLKLYNFHYPDICRDSNIGPIIKELHDVLGSRALLSKAIVIYADEFSQRCNDIWIYHLQAFKQPSHYTNGTNTHRLTITLTISQINLESHLVQVDNKSDLNKFVVSVANLPGLCETIRREAEDWQYKCVATLSKLPVEKFAKTVYSTLRKAKSVRGSNELMDIKQDNKGQQLLAHRIKRLLFSKISLPCEKLDGNQIATQVALLSISKKQSWTHSQLWMKAADVNFCKMFEGDALALVADEIAKFIES